MSRIAEFLRLLVGFVAWIVVIVFLLWFLQGFWEGISEFAASLFEQSEK
ncbi:hypothetical protein K1720_06565 [Thermococcus argininiproducens]|uniref:Uncharacterized protein n=1 Tax=Thermococcus argininiproducens TaxID=2866384 RepID=A0A9E7M941_9EURY|nr:hypothetical protein [Thermococcus argininiproducens]USG99207.1 hypothetical protein K1720_06565 [Thermococcus argininiproducens]